MMSSVEDIPAGTIMASLPWGWEGYGEYLQALGRRRLGVNAGGMVGHAALRYYVMGARSLDEAPARAHGYDYMLVNGTMLVDHDELTAERPGQLVTKS